MLASPSLREFLLGRWSVNRTLEDLASGATGTFTGTATFTEHDDDALLHREQGTLAWASHAPSTATRTLIWRPTSHDTADVFFEDGRFFHSLNLGEGTDTPEHLCSPDIYRGAFSIDGSDEWTYAWRVTGPQKNLILSTRMTRQMGQTTSAR